MSGQIGLPVDELADLNSTADRIGDPGGREIAPMELNLAKALVEGVASRTECGLRLFVK